MANPRWMGGWRADRHDITLLTRMPAPAHLRMGGIGRQKKTMDTENDPFE